MSKQFTLGKNERLKSRKQIEKLFAEGKSFVAGPFRVYYLIDEMINAQRSLFNVQFGIGVSSKNFKRSVDRNRIKRLTKEAWRLQKSVLKETLRATTKQMNVFIIYTGKEVPGYNLIFEKVSLVIKKLSKAIE